MIRPADPASGPSPLASERFRLARLARAVALGVPGVVGTDAGPVGLFVTESGGERVEGVMCVAAQDGGYDVSLRLVCALVPLMTLGERIRTALQSAARRAEIPLQSVNVHVAAVAGIDAR